MNGEYFELVSDIAFQPIAGTRYFVEHPTIDVEAEITIDALLPGETITISNSNITPTRVLVFSNAFKMVGDLDTVHQGERLVIEMGQYARFVCIRPGEIQIVQP